MILCINGFTVCWLWLMLLDIGILNIIFATNICENVIFNKSWYHHASTGMFCLGSGSQEDQIKNSCVLKNMSGRTKQVKLIFSMFITASVIIWFALFYIPPGLGCCTWSCFQPSLFLSWSSSFKFSVCPMVYPGCINPLSEIQLEKLLSPSVGCLFIQVMVSWAAHKQFGSQWCHFSIVGLSAYRIKVLFTKSFHVSIYSSSFSSVSSTKFIVSGLCWDSWLSGIEFFSGKEIKIQSHFSTCYCLVWLEPLEDFVYFPMCNLN